jgi:hypothetical protein
MKRIWFAAWLTVFWGVGVGAAELGGGSNTLPVKEIILYSSGTGFFQRAGEVEDKSVVELRFKADDINDLLKSMVVQDLGGGSVAAVTYDSRDPVTKTLRSFSVDLTDNPTMGQLLNQARGEKVTVSWPNAVTGTIVGIEKKEEQVKKGDEPRILEVEYLNLLTEEGLMSIPLHQVQKLKLLNPQVDGELRQALEVLAKGHDTQKKTVAVTFDGKGKRQVQISYIAQAPVWKTSYRLVIDEKEPFLQGWAIVENTSDEDWSNVQLSLVSGRPISFVMDLYQPLYTTRPVVQPELYLSLAPQVYGDALGKMMDQPVELREAKEENESLATAKSKRGFGGAFGMAPSAPAALPGGGARAEAASAFYAGAKLALADGVASAAAGAVTGELFEYAIKTPVSIARQKSAMLPIVSEPASGKKLSIYNQNVQPKFPLNGYRLKNTSSLHLMQGPITIFDGGSYAGDARIEDLAPGQERLISYALDLKTEVDPEAKSGPEELVSVKIRKGTLFATRKYSQEKTYTIRNKDSKAKTILIEHPFRADWSLVEPKNPAEKTRDFYRFEVKVDPDKTGKLVVREEMTQTEQALISSFNPDTYEYYLRSSKLSNKAKEALRRVVQMKEKLSESAAQRSRREQRSNEITQEQTRIRENMARLAQNSELYTRYVKKLDEQETQLEQLRKEIESFKDTESKQQRELNEYLSNVDLE